MNMRRHDRTKKRPHVTRQTSKKPFHLAVPDDLVVAGAAKKQKDESGVAVATALPPAVSASSRSKKLDAPSDFVFRRKGEEAPKEAKEGKEKEEEEEEEFFQPERAEVEAAVAASQEAQEFETTLARVMKLAGALPAAASNGTELVDKVFRTKLRTGLTSLDAALVKQKDALARLDVNAKDKEEFTANNAKMQARKQRAEAVLEEKTLKNEAAKKDLEMLEWAATQLDKLEELTPKSAKSRKRRQLKDVAKGDKSSAILSKLDELSLRIKSIVDAL